MTFCVYFKLNAQLFEFLQIIPLESELLKQVPTESQLILLLVSILRILTVLVYLRNRHAAVVGEVSQTTISLYAILK